MSHVPIADHAFLSDCASAALVTRAGSVDWWSPGSFDAPSVFGRLVGEEAGHFSIRPTDTTASSSRAYRRGSLVLETAWSTEEGQARVTDALMLPGGQTGHDLGRASPSVLMREVRCLAGAMEMEVEFAPRPEYGLVHPRLTRRPGGVLAVGGDSAVALHTAVELDIEQTGSTARARLRMREGDAATFAVTRSDPWIPDPAAWTAEQVRDRIDETHRAWLSWSAIHQAYEGPLRDLVWQSGVVLRGLTFARTGAIVAAATTSLPEGVGSGRTWDYRYSWVRDASLTLQGLFVAACPDEAAEFFSYLARVGGERLSRGLGLQVMFGVRGNLDLSERELDHLEGWRASGPVRIGNGAWRQRQLDVYGAALDAAHLLRDQLVELDHEARDFLVAAADTVCASWEDDDQGIWEIRGDARPFLHSKLMCWLALDRALALGDVLRAPAETCRTWQRVREEIRTAIETRGWSASVGAYTQAFGSDALDASALLLVTSGFHARDDQRLLRTIDAVERGLSDGRGLLFRYRGDDGFDAREGAFLLCTFWLAEALAVTDQPARARAVLDRAASYATDLGLMAEQVDPETGELLGNFPQAFSHLGLARAAHALMVCEARAGADGRSGPSS
ncbi:MAG: glycoside hydrolase family 15 protein [Marmoricola sp.]